MTYYYFKMVAKVVENVNITNAVIHFHRCKCRVTEIYAYKNSYKLLILLKHSYLAYKNSSLLVYGDGPCKNSFFVASSSSCCSSVSGFFLHCSHSDCTFSWLPPFQFCQSVKLHVSEMTDVLYFCGVCVRACVCHSLCVVNG